MIVAQARRPRREGSAQFAQHVEAAIEFDAVALAVVEGDRIDDVKTLQGPRQASRRILAAGKQNERVALVHCPGLAGGASA